MSVIREVLEELWSMFVGDRRLTLLLLLVVGLGAALAVFTAYHLLAAGLIFAGAVAVLADSVFHAARKARR
jgi:uncharacterized membrane protein